MKLSTRTRRRFVTKFVVGIAVAGIAVPTAQARPEGMSPQQWLDYQTAREAASDARDALSVDGRRIMSGASSAVIADVTLGKAIAESDAPGLGAVDRERVKSRNEINLAQSRLGPESVRALGGDRPSDVRRPDLVAPERPLGIRETDRYIPDVVTVPAASPVSSPGFDWGAAALGATSAFAFALLLGGTLLATRRLSRVSHGLAA